MSNSDLKKILDELQLNRLSIENDRKSYDKVKTEIKAAVDKVNKLTERWGSVQRKIKELAEVIAIKTSDIGMQNIKIQVMDERCIVLEEIVQQKMNERELVHEKRGRQLCRQLDQLDLFICEWNSGWNGRAYRKLLLETGYQMYETRSASKLKDLDSITTPLRELERSEKEKSDMENEYRRSVRDLQKKERQIQSEMKEVDSQLSVLKRKRKEAKGPGQEATRLAEQITKTREDIASWESRVSEIENDWLRNKKTGGRAKKSEKENSGPVNKKNPSYRVSMPASVRSKKSSPIKVIALENSTDGDNNLSSRDDIHIGEISTTTPRSFQFKKKSSSEAHAV